MFKKYITTCLYLVWTVAAWAENNITVSFVDTPLPAALRTIEQLADDDITINFSFRKLEDYTVTTEIIDALPLDAVKQAIGFYPIKISTTGNVVTVQPLLNTDYKVIGRLVNENSEGVDFATIALLSLPDSAVITSGVSNLRGDFVLPVQTPAPMALKASRIGYSTITVPIVRNNMGEIKFETNPQMLKTLTAYSNRNIISTAGAVTSIRIEGTPFSQIGTLADLLPNLPGLSLQPAAFGIPASNGIVYYINGREVSETAQLNSLQTNEVQTITIDKAPGAEYPANAAVVVNISTIKSPNDFIYLQLGNTVNLRHKISDIPTLDFKMQLGKFTTALNYQHDFLQSKIQESIYRTVDSPDNKSYLLSIRNGYEKNRGPRLSWSGEMQFNPRNRIGLYLYLYSLNKDADASGKTQSIDYGEYDVSSYLRSHTNLYSGTLSYDYAGKRLTAHMAQDIAYSDPYTNLNVIEQQGNTSTSRFDSNNHEYFIATTNAKLGVNLSSQTLLNLGGRYSYIESHSNKYFMDSPYAFEYGVTNGAYGGFYKHNCMNVNESTKQGYLSLSQRIANFTIVPGIRYEHYDRWISDDAIVSNPNPDNSNEIETFNYIYDRKYSRWLPSLLIKFSTGDFRTYFNYDSRMTQPTFSMLNSGLVYEDNFTYYRSNPLLKPTVIDDFRLSMGYRGLSADIGYSTVKNAIAEIEETGDKKGILYRTPINLRKYHEFDVNLAYSSSIGSFGYYAAANLIFPGWHTVEYSSQKATFNAEVNLSYKFNSKFSIYTSFKHFGSCRWLVYDRLDSQIWNFGFNASLLHNRLNINVEGTDLLDRNNMMSISTVYNNVVSRRYAGCDTHGVKVRIAYTLFNKPIRTSVKRGNIDDIDRIEK